MNNLVGFGCQEFVYHSSSSNNRETATAAAATPVPQPRRRLASSTANIFRRLFGLQSKHKSKKINSIVLETATMASIEATPNRGPSKQQNQISGQLYKYTNVVKGEKLRLQGSVWNYLQKCVWYLSNIEFRVAISLVHSRSASGHIELLFVREFIRWLRSADGGQHSEVAGKQTMLQRCRTFVQITFNHSFDLAGTFGWRCCLSQRRRLTHVHH